MVARPAMLRWSVAAVLIAAIAAAGCTTIPTRELATYKDTFAKARTAGEAVVLDYGVAAAQKEAISAKEDVAKPVQKKRGEPFDPNAASRNLTTVDIVLVRMQAWDVVARYNDLLTALAEGKPADELAGAVDGLSASIKAFPVKEIAATAAEFSAYLAPLRALALEAAKEYYRRQFIEAVGKGAPLINDKFLKLLRADAGNFYQVRKGLNALEFDELADIANSTGSRLGALAAAFQANSEASGAVKAFNAGVKRLPLSSEGKPLVTPVNEASPRGAVPVTPEAKAQLGSLAQSGQAQLARVAAKDEELRAYRQVLVAYVALLDQLEQSLRSLQAAAEQAQPANVLQGADLERAVVMLREAYMAYKDKEKD